MVYFPALIMAVQFKNQWFCVCVCLCRWKNVWMRLDQPIKSGQRFFIPALASAQPCKPAGSIRHQPEEKADWQKKKKKTQITGEIWKPL